MLCLQVVSLKGDLKRRLDKTAITEKKKKKKKKKGESETQRHEKYL